MRTFFSMSTVVCVFAVALLVGSLATEALATGYNEYCDTTGIDSCSANCNPDVTGACGTRICNSSSALTAACNVYPFYQCTGIQCPGTCAGTPAFACRCYTTGQGC